MSTLLKHFRELLDDTDSRVAYYSSAFLLKVRVLFSPTNCKFLLGGSIDSANLFYSVFCSE